MKKLKTLFVALLICVTTCFSFLFTSCSGKETYKFESCLYNDYGDEFKIGIGETFQGLNYKEDTFIFILYDNNTFMLRFDHGVEDSHDSIEIFTGTWENGYNDEIYLIPDPYQENYIMEDITIAKKDGAFITIDLSEYMKLTLKK